MHIPIRILGLECSLGFCFFIKNQGHCRLQTGLKIWIICAECRFKPIIGSRKFVQCFLRRLLLLFHLHRQQRHRRLTGHIRNLDIDVIFFRSHGQSHLFPGSFSHIPVGSRGLKGSLCLDLFIKGQGHRCFLSYFKVRVIFAQCSLESCPGGHKSVKPLRRFRLLYDLNRHIQKSERKLAVIGSLDGKSVCPRCGLQHDLRPCGRDLSLFRVAGSNHKLCLRRFVKNSRDPYPVSHLVSLSTVG